MAESIAIKYQQLTDAIQEITSVLTRIDERVEIFIGKINTLEEKIENHTNKFGEICSRISVLESKNGNLIRQEMREEFKDIREDITSIKKEIEEMKISNRDIHLLSSTSDKRWKTIGLIVLNIFGPLIYIMIGAILLRYFGLQAPATP